jgi:hypothetical protein
MWVSWGRCCGEDTGYQRSDIRDQEARGGGLHEKAAATQAWWNVNRNVVEISGGVKPPRVEKYRLKLCYA